MGDDKDRAPPIQPLEYLAGVKVVDIGDLRVARGMTRRPSSSCRHRHLHYDTQERRVWCADCERDVEAYDAFVLLVAHFSQADADIKRRLTRLEEAEQHKVISLAAKEIDKAWRSRREVPACPHCHQGLFPEDFKNGIGAHLGRDYAEALRRRSKEKKTNS